MCPLMSAWATLIFKFSLGFFPRVWLGTFLRNLPMALFWQLLVAGSLVRWAFSLPKRPDSHIFREKTFLFPWKIGGGWLQYGHYAKFEQQSFSLFWVALAVVPSGLDCLRRNQAIESDLAD